MVATLFMRDESSLNSPPYRFSILLPKIYCSYVLKTYRFCYVRLVLKILSSTAILEIPVPCLLNLESYLSLTDTSPKTIWKIQLPLFCNVKTFYVLLELLFTHLLLWRNTSLYFELDWSLSLKNTLKMLLMTYENMK